MVRTLGRVPVASLISAVMMSLHIATPISPRVIIKTKHAHEPVNTVGVVLADGDEGDWDAGRNSGSVLENDTSNSGGDQSGKVYLSVEVLYVTVRNERRAWLRIKRTASIPASARVCVLTPPSRV